MDNEEVELFAKPSRMAMQRYASETGTTSSMGLALTNASGSHTLRSIASKECEKESTWSSLRPFKTPRRRA